MLLKAYFIQLPKKSKFYNVRLKHLACRMTKPSTKNFAHSSPVSKDIRCLKPGFHMIVTITTIAEKSAQRS